MKNVLLIKLLCFFYLSSVAQDLTPFKNEKGKWGFKNSAGTIVVPAKYDNAWSFNEGRAKVRNKKEKYGYIDRSGNEIIPPKYENAHNFNEGLASVKLNGKYGFIDSSGKEVIPLKYDETGNFSEGLASVRFGSTIDEKYGTLKGGKWGFIDKSGNEVIPLKYERAGTFSEGLAYVELNDRFGYIDAKGKEVIPFLYHDANDFSEGLARVRMGSYFDGKYGFIDKTGNEVIPIQYEDAGNFYNGEARVKLNGKTFYIDKTGSNEEIRKKKAEEEAERLKKERKEMVDKAIALAKRDTLARDVLNLYLVEDPKLLEKVKDLQRTVESTMIFSEKYGFNKQHWASMSGIIESKVKIAKAQILAYQTLLKQYESIKGKNELYDRQLVNLEKISAYVSSCSGWADYISTLGGEVKDDMAAFDYVANGLTALKQHDDALRSFIALYKYRNSL